MEKAANNPQTPEKLRSTLTRLVTFFRGTGNPGVPIPANGPSISQFGLPSVATKCINGTSNAIGQAVAVPGPATLPLPGVPSGHIGYIFTAHGTGPVAKKQTTAMTAHWINLNTGKYGSNKLSYNKINPDGPATINTVAPTGKGTVVTLIEGGVTTQEDNGSAQCQFTPTAGVTQVR